MTNQERRKLAEKIQTPWLHATALQMIEQGLMEERRRMADPARNLNRRWDDHPPVEEDDR